MHRLNDHQQESPTARAFTFDVAAQMCPTAVRKVTLRNSITRNSNSDSSSNHSLLESSNYSSNKESSTDSSRTAFHIIPSPGYEEHERERRKCESFLERNRVVTIKYCKKGKEHAKHMESLCETVLQENTILQTEVVRLQGEILNLKNKLCCDIPNAEMRGSSANWCEWWHRFLTGSSKQFQKMTSGFDDLVALPASEDGSFAEARKDMEQLPD
ncbi:hypothetical protein CBS147323_10271 [Aspergillus niger]|nr:hypothetical protein CBS147323_10271 [Aspergillus niger]